MKAVVHHPNFVQVIATLEPMLREYSPLMLMSFDNLCDYMSWFWNRGTMAWSIDENGPQGVCLIKLFRHLSQFVEPAVHEPCGRFVMIELLKGNHPLAIAKVCNELCDRWGPQHIVMWERGERTESSVPRMMTWATFRKLARRITFNLLE
jgi:hypothetical protein